MSGWLAALFIFGVPITAFCIPMSFTSTRMRALYAMPFQLRSAARPLATMVLDVLDQPGWTWDQHTYGTHRHVTGIQIRMSGPSIPSIWLPSGLKANIPGYLAWRIGNVVRSKLRAEANRQMFAAEHQFAENVISFAQNVRQIESRSA